jgi:hypothetical protein
MGFLWLLVCVVAAVILVFNLLMVPFAISEGMDGLDEFFNPKTLYKLHKVNVFGSIVLMLLWNVVFAPHALYFWFYKLCTVGRGGSNR